jgi:hypothetical protein
VVQPKYPRQPIQCVETARFEFGCVDLICDKHRLRPRHVPSGGVVLAAPLIQKRNRANAFQEQVNGPNQGIRIDRLLEKRGRPPFASLRFGDVVAGADDRGRG